MKLTSSDLCRVEPGVFVGWQLVASGVSSPSSAPPTENERFHLDSVRRGDAGWIAVTIDFPEIVAIADLDRAIAAVLTRHDVLRGYFAVRGDRVQRRIHRAVSATPQPDQALSSLPSTIAFTDAVVARISEECTPLRPASHFFGAVARAESTTLIAAFDHCYVDARSLAIIAAEISSIIGGRELDAPPSGLGVISDLAVRDADVAPDDDRLRGWGEFLAASNWAVPEFPLDLGLAPGDHAPTHTQVRTLVSFDDAAALSSLLHRRRGRTYPAVLTAVAVAVRRLGGPDRLATIIPAGCPEGEDTVAWLVGNAPLWIDGDADDLLALAADNTERLAAALPLAEIGLTPVYAAFGERLHRARNDIFMMSYVDYTRLPTTPAEVSVTQISSAKPSDTAQWWLWRDDDGIHARVRHPDTDLAVDTIAAVLDAAAELLSELAVTSVQTIRRAG